MGTVPIGTKRRVEKRPGTGTTARIHGCAGFIVLLGRPTDT